VHVVEVDLTQGPQLVPSGSNGDRPLEVDGQTTLAFALEQKCQVAINASPFDPVEQEPGAPKNLVGIAVTDGELFSRPHPRHGAFVVSEDGAVRILPPPIDPARLSKARHVVGGFQLLLSDGRDVSRASIHVRGRHPRTAVGVSRDGRRVWLLVVDGRQRGFSEGVSLRELARMMASLGAYDALNLDGGGSTTLVMRRGSDAYVVNSPIHEHVPGRLRVVGSSLCVFAEPLPAVSSR
jgi:exopolysaccharide biosynthesis protein